MLSRGALPEDAGKVWPLVREWWPLAVVVGVGAYLRLTHLGALGFRWDEDLSGLAVRAILEKGVPELPSGMIYLRGGVFSHLMAASASLFGFSEFALRLPAALFGIALIPVAYCFGAALFGRVVGLVTAALLAISFWDIDLARYARFYSAFSVMYVLTLYAIWRFRVIAPSTAGGALCIALAIVTLSLHDLAYSLALAFFYPLVLRGPEAWLRPREWLWPVASSAVLAASYLGWREYVQWSRALPVLGEAGSGAVAVGGEIDELRRSFIALPDMPLLTGMLERMPLFVPLLALAAVACALLVTRRLGSPLRERGLLAFVAACAATQFFNLALLGAFVLAFVKRKGLPALRSAEVLLAGALIGATFAVWVGAALFAQVDLGPPLQPLTLRTVVRELLDFPYFYVFWGFPNEWPLAAAVASIGALVAFHRAAYRGDAAAGFALLALAGPIVGNALFSSPFEIFRYNAAFNTLFFVFVALAFVHWRELVPAWRPALPRPLVSRTVAALGTTLLVLLVTAYDLNPLRGWLAVERQYSNDGALYRTFGMTAYSDFKTTAAFVARNASPHDLIVTPDSREYYNYLGRVDYWLRSGRYADQSYRSQGTLRDLYVGAPLVKTLPDLEAVLALPNRTKWVLASSAALTDPKVPVAAEIRAFLRNAEQRVVYVGLDRDHKVYRFE